MRRGCGTSAWECAPPCRCRGYHPGTCHSELRVHFSVDREVPQLDVPRFRICLLLLQISAVALRRLRHRHQPQTLLKSASRTFAWRVGGRHARSTKAQLAKLENISAGQIALAGLFRRQGVAKLGMSNHVLRLCQLDGAGPGLGKFRKRKPLSYRSKLADRRPQAKSNLIPPNDDTTNPHDRLVSAVANGLSSRQVARAHGIATAHAAHGAAATPPRRGNP